MEFIKPLVLGIIEGITEFLPISSTGHLLIANKILDFKDDSEVFTVVIQLGAILAALWYFRHEIKHLLQGAIHGNKEDKNFIGKVFIGLLPAGCIGFLVEATVGLPNSLLLVGTALVVGGIILWATEKWIDSSPLDKESEINYNSITYKKALIVGVSQSLAIIPGVSRSGATIVSALLCRINRPTATAFSFYLSVPLITAASALKIVKDFSAIRSISGGLPALTIGTLVAFISAFIAVTWLLKYVQKHDYKPFAYYRILLGIILLLLVK